MTNPDTMTLQECCNALARFHGWGLPGDPGLLSDGTGVTLTRYRRTVDNGPGWARRDVVQVEHPFSTLDSIAGALPADWVWCIISHMDNEVDAMAHRKGECGDDDKTIYMRGDTELLARARAAVKAWIAVK